MKLFKLKGDDEKKINQILWAGPKNQGTLDMMPVAITMTDESCPIQVRQCPISLEGQGRLQPITDSLIRIKPWNHECLLTLP